MGPYRVLVVDDDEGIRRLLGSYLQHLGYSVESAASTNDAIRAIEKGYFDLIVSDIRMPGRDGMELLAWVTKNRRETGIIMLSGCDDVKLAVRAMRDGALDYIVKPFELANVAQTISTAIGRQKQESEREKYLGQLESALAQRSGELRHTMNQLQEASQDTLDALTTALDAREKETQAHSSRVSEYSAHLAREFGITGAHLDVIRNGSMLHDIGKIGVSDRILLKPGRLTDDEWVEMRKHPEIGAWILSGVESLRPASDIVIAHHERFDGAGYPYGLKGDRIPVGARIFAVADSLDAMMSDRPYRRGQPYEYARREIERNSGSQFDPKVVDSFLRTPPQVWNQIRERTLTPHLPTVFAR
jgi:putative nucleotidyltransferase with HDIG domain